MNSKPGVSSGGVKAFQPLGMVTSYPAPVTTVSTGGGGGVGVVGVAEGSGQLPPSQTGGVVSFLAQDEQEINPIDKRDRTKNKRFILPSKL